MLLTPSKANKINLGSLIFAQGVWTSVPDSELDYLLCRWCPYPLQEDTNSGPYWVRNTGSKTSFKYYNTGSDRRISIKPGKDVAVDRYIAYQLLRRHDIEASPVPEILGKCSKVLVIRYGGLGDVLMTLPGLSKIKAEFPNVSFDYSTSDYLVRLLEGNSAVDRIFGYHGYDGDDYDAVIDLRRTVEIADDSREVSRMDIFARHFGVVVDDYSMPYKVSDKDRGEVDGLVPENPIIVQASGSVPRRTPPKSKILEIIEGIASSGHTPVVVDDRRDDDFSIEGVVNLTGMLTIPQLFAIIERAHSVIAGDSGVLHAANALKKRNVGLFGCVDHRLRVKDQPHCTPIQCNEWSSCSPCNDLQTKQCSRPDLCLAYVPTELIIEKAVG